MDLPVGMFGVADVGAAAMQNTSGFRKYQNEEVERKRQEAFTDKGCGHWVAEVNKAACSFPACFCYPFWQRKYRNEVVD